ncbi:hypothetical protein EVG20_g6654 [Dentipellis fragilis]|uniref:Uncharacterized protein n=1 Tax=Dentipellis fragilis TaxID=205917 RepID=A0A4Y9YLB1_9AGAM|nr:hypothetical protein EVG20_g6654 [Dentipellis fragilis]
MIRSGDFVSSARRRLQELADLDIKALRRISNAQDKVLNRLQAKIDDEDSEKEWISDDEGGKAGSQSNNDESNGTEEEEADGKLATTDSGPQEAHKKNGNLSTA